MGESLAYGVAQSLMLISLVTVATLGVVRVRFLVSWSQYVLTLLIGGGRVITLPVLLFAAVSGGNPASIAGLALLFAAPPMLAIALAARTLGRGTAEIGQQY